MRMFLSVYFQPTQTFAGKAGAYPSGASWGLLSKAKHLAPPVNVTLGRKWPALSNPFAYNSAVKQLLEHHFFLLRDILWSKL